MPTAKITEIPQLARNKEKQFLEPIKSNNLISNLYETPIKSY